MFPVRLVLLSEFLRLAVSVIAHPDHTIVSTLAQKHTGVLTNLDCNVTCAEFYVLGWHCEAPDCSCNIPYLQALGNCSVCISDTFEEVDRVQGAMDHLTAECNREGIEVNFQFQLPPAVPAILYSKRHTSQPMRTHSLAALRRYQVSFLVLQIAGGHVGLGLVLFTAFFSRKVHRHPTFYNFCITWIFSSIVFSLSLYRGMQNNTLARPLEVSRNMCLAQAELVNGVQAMTACSTMAVVTELWLNLRIAIQFRSDIPRGPKPAKWITTVLLVAPYILFLVFTSIFVSTRRSGAGPLASTNFYCVALKEEAPNFFVRAFYGVTLGLLLLTVYFDAHIIYILSREWYAFQQLQLEYPVKLSTLLRVIAFSIFRVVVAVAYGTLLFKPVDGSDGEPALEVFYSEVNVPVWIDILQASIPFVAFLIFGMNKDTMFALAFWRDIETEKTQNDVGEAPAV